MVDVVEPEAKPKIKYVAGNESMLNQIEHLWLGLNQQNIECSPYFVPYYLALTFQKRKAALLQKANAGELRVELVVDESNGQSIGYCVSSFEEAAQTGEVESVFIEKAYRKFGVGDSLMRSALAWMDHKGAVTKLVAVAAGNEQVFSFYERLGFRKRKYVLEQVKGP